MFQNSVSESACALFEDSGTERPHWLPEMSLHQDRAIEMADRVINAAQEFKRQMMLDEPDTGFVPAEVMRQVHVYAMDNPQVTVAAVVGRAVKLLFQNYLNCEEMGPDLARIILAGRMVEPVVEAVPSVEADILDQVVTLLPVADLDDTEDKPRRKVRKPDPKRVPWTPSPFVALTDAEWEQCEPLLPAGKETGRPRETDLRGVLSAIAHHWRTGCPWRMMPDSLPPWPTCYTYFKRLLRSGVTPQLRAIILDDAKGVA